jgi:sec-independent protein translocase protein TatC
MTATDPRRSEQAEEPQDLGQEMTLFEHLAELRDRIFKSAVAIVLGLVAGFIVYRPVLDILIRPYCELPSELRFPSTVLDPENCQLVVTDVLGQFFLVIKVSAVVAVILAGPIVCYQIWRFVTPGLRPLERKYALPFIVISQLLFVGGAVFSYYLLPRALEVLLGFAGENIGSLLEANEYLRFLIHMMIGFGVAFELPLILISLVLMGAVTSRTLRTYRRHALFGTFVASAIITPTTDPLTMSLMAGPLVFFYELSVFVARVVEKRRRAKAAAA